MKKTRSLTVHSIRTVLAVLVFALCPGSAVRAQGTPKDEPGGEAKLSSEEALRMAEALKKLVNRSTDGLVQVRHPDGSVSMDLQGRFQSVTVAKREADGSISQSCVDNAKSAAVFFGIDLRLLESSKDVPKEKPGGKQPGER